MEITLLRDLSLPTKKALARPEHISRCLRLERGLFRAASWSTQMLAGMLWVAPAQGLLCGAALRPLRQPLSSPTPGHEKTFPDGQWKIARKCLCPA